MSHKKDAGRSGTHGADSPPPPAAQAQGGGQAPAQPPAPAEAAADPVKALRDERDDLLGRLQRVSADFLNYQKRVGRDVEQARQYANEQLIRELLGVLDDMERAMAAARAHPDAEGSLLAGMELVHDKAMRTLGKFGLETIEAEGKPFDPDVHAALMEEPSADRPPRTVLKVLQKGYALRGRTLRPSSVIVSKAAEAPPVQPDRPGEPEEAADADV